MNTSTPLATTACDANKEIQDGEIYVREPRNAEFADELGFGQTTNLSFGFVDLKTKQPVEVPLGTTLKVTGLPPSIMTALHIKRDQPEWATYMLSDTERVPVFFFPLHSEEFKFDMIVEKRIPAFRAEVVNLPFDGPVNADIRRGVEAYQAANKLLDREPSELSV